MSTKIKIKSSLQIRRAVSSDIPAIVRIQINAWESGYGYPLIYTFKQLFFYELEKRWHRKINQGMTILVLAEQQKIIGFLCYSPDQKKPLDAVHAVQINQICITPARRLKGLGRLLWKAAQTEMRKIMLQQVMVWIVKTDNQLRRFYECIGFRATTDVRIENVDDGVVVKEIRYETCLSQR